MVVEDYSLAVATWVVAYVVDRGFPVFDELHHVTCQLPQMLDCLKHQLQFVFPAFSSLFLQLVALFIPLELFALLPDELQLHLLFLLNGPQTLFNVQFSQLSHLPSHVHQTDLSGFNCLSHHPVRIFLTAHVLDL